jgi:hypothetical protein
LKQHFLQKLYFDVQYLAGLSRTKYALAFALKNAGLLILRTRCKTNDEGAFRRDCRESQETVNNLGYHNYTITFFESISWWTNDRIKEVQEQFSTQYVLMTEGLKKKYSQEDPLKSNKDQMFLKRSWVTLGEAFPSLKRDDLYQALGSIGVELALYTFPGSDISRFDDMNGQMRRTLP